MANFIDGVISPGTGGTEYELYADTTQFIPYWKAENSPNPGTGGISMYVRYRTIPESFPVPSVGDMTITKSGVVLRVTSVTSTEVHYEVVGGVTTDDTLELKGVPADAEKTGDEIESVKSRVTAIEDKEPPDPPALDGVYPLAATVNNGHPSVGWSADLGFRVVDGLINITWEE